MRLEDALRSIPGCAEVTLPFWDETSQSSKSNGVPWALTVENFQLDGKTIPNPLRSFVFNKTIKDHISGDNPDYSKPVGYETVRYPLSGLLGPNDIANTKAHNAQYPDYNTNVGLLNANIIDWLNSYIVVNDKKLPTDVAQKYADCLNALNYTVFSNTSSFFHHCFVDRVFWFWHKRHRATDHIEIISQYPGTNTVDNQGPTPGMPPNSWLTLHSPLDPFRKRDGSAYTSRDWVNIETQLGYTYGPGSLEDVPALTPWPRPPRPCNAFTWPALTGAPSAAPS